MEPHTLAHNGEVAMSTILPATTLPRAIIIIPGDVNYFYNQSGRRIAEATRALGYWTEVCTLNEWQNIQSTKYDELCVLSNVKEILHAYGEESEGIQRIRDRIQSVKRTVSLAIDCVSTHWFRILMELSIRCGVHEVWDLGLCNQSGNVPTDLNLNYQFVFNGLTPTEQTSLQTLPSDANRVFPWAFVGHNTPSRVALVDYLVQKVHPGGFVYVPSLTPYREKNSPHLNQQQYEQVLRRTNYQVWCSHHDHYYMEPERFRTSLLTGSVPIKVIDKWTSIPTEAPFHYLMTTMTELPERLTRDVFTRVRGQYAEEWSRMPTLTESIGKVLDLNYTVQESSSQNVAKAS